MAHAPSRDRRHADARFRGAAADARTVVRRHLPLALLLVAVACVYASALRAPFFRDDHMLVLEDPRVQEPRSALEHFGRAYWAGPAGPVHSAYYRPLVTLSFALDWRLGGGRAAPFHATNVALHLVVCALVFALARRGGATASAAALGAALFGLMPRLTEAVTWISGRTDLLAGGAALAALLVWDRSRGRAAARAAAAALLLLGLLAKEVALAGALAIAAYEIARARERGERPQRAAAALAPIAIAAAAWAALRLAAGSALLPDPFGWPLRLLLAFQSLGTYACMLLDPLHPQLAIGRLGVLEPWKVVIGVASAALSIGALVRAVRPPAPPLRVGLVALAAASLAPALHLVPIPLSAVAADRLLYLPLAALAAALAPLAGRPGARRARVAAAGALALAAVFATATWARNLDWRDEVRLWALELERAPGGSSEAHRELGALLSWRRQPEQALAHYLAAYRIEAEVERGRPSAGVDRMLRGNLALVLSELGRYDEALGLLARLAHERPRDPRARLQLGAVHARRLEFDRAERELQAALELDAEQRIAAQLLTQVRAARERWGALPPPADAEPTSVKAARAEVYFQVGRLPDAERLWSRVALAPDATPEQIERAARRLARFARDRQAAARAMERVRP
jgi:tetratricopeptide (TPR) repeat protein